MNASRLLFRIIDQDAPHHLSCYEKEMRAILPVDVLPVDKPYESLINQSSRLQRMLRTLPPHVVTGELTQLPVDNGREFLQCFLVPIAPILQQACEFARRGHGFFRVFQMLTRPTSNWNAFRWRLCLRAFAVYFLD